MHRKQGFLAHLFIPLSRKNQPLNPGLQGLATQRLQEGPWTPNTDQMLGGFRREQHRLVGIMPGLKALPLTQTRLQGPAIRALLQHRDRFAPPVATCI